MGSATSQISYTASKGGVLAMSRELGVQFARQGIRVNALCPGPVNTPLLQELFAKDPERAARRLVHVPMGRFAEPEELAAAVAFLASDDASFITAVDVPGRRRHQLGLRRRRCRDHRHDRAAPAPQPQPLQGSAASGAARQCLRGHRRRGCCETIRLGVLAPGEVAAAGTRTGRPARRQPRHGAARPSNRWPRRATGVAARAGTAALSWPTRCPSPSTGAGIRFSRAEIDDALRLREILEVGARAMAAAGRR